MATVSFGTTEVLVDTNLYLGMYASVNLPDVKATGNTFTIPSVSATLTSAVWGSYYYPQASYQKSATYSTGVYINGVDTSSNLYFSGGYLYMGESKNWWAQSDWSATSQGFSLSTSNYFNSSNPTTKTLPITLVLESWQITNDASGGYWNGTYTGTGSSTLTLDAPPTFNSTQVAFDTNFVYAGLTTASVTVSSLSAKYGGTVKTATLKIGSQTVTKQNPSNNDTLSILLNSSGSFTPTVTITDSRNQTTTKTLNEITVNTYVKPSVRFTIERTLPKTGEPTPIGKPDDEGESATITATFTFTDVIATLSAPTVTVTDQDGTTTTVTPTWYSSRAQDGTLSGTVTWGNLSTGATVYGLVSGFNTQYSYQISVTPEDSEDVGVAQTQTLGSAFYTVDFLAGGHGIAFGKPASNTGFECAMTALFEDTVQADGTATFGSDVLIGLPEYQTVGTTDKAIYDAVVALGWDSDVLVN